MIENNIQCPGPHLVETFGEINTEENLNMPNDNNIEECQHSWVANSGNGGTPEYRKGLGATPTMHVLCSECNARTRFTEVQWHALEIYQAPEKVPDYLDIPDFLRRQDLVAEQIDQLQASHLNLTKQNADLQDKVDRLVQHSAVLAIDLVGDGCDDSSNESWRSLPDDLQEAINEQEEKRRNDPLI